MVSSNTRKSDPESDAHQAIAKLDEGIKTPKVNRGLSYRHITEELKSNYEETINNLAVFRVNCGSCGAVHKGRYYHVGWCEPIRYCNECANIHHQVGNYSPKPPSCSCGGLFNSIDLKCPDCGKVIQDREMQLAYQQYDVEGDLEVEKASDEQIREWYDELRRNGYFTGDTLYIQIQEALMFDDDGKPTYYKAFEV